MGQHYDHLKERLIAHYAAMGIDVEVEPRGKGMPDMLGRKGASLVFAGEVKNDVEAGGSPGSWWSFWIKPERDLRRFYKTLPADSFKGWCAVIDGQLRKYCWEHHVSQGDLAVENGTHYASDVAAAVRFLVSEGRLSAGPGAAESGISYWTVRF